MFSPKSSHEQKIKRDSFDPDFDYFNDFESISQTRKIEIFWAEKQTRSQKKQNQKIIFVIRS